MKATVVVTEVLTIEKTVEVEVADDAEDSDIEDAARCKACEDLCLDDIIDREQSGWDIVGSEGMTCEIKLNETSEKTNSHE